MTHKGSCKSLYRFAGLTAEVLACIKAGKVGFTEIDAAVQQVKDAGYDKAVGFVNADKGFSYTMLYLETAACKMSHWLTAPAEVGEENLRAWLPSDGE